MHFGSPLCYREVEELKRRIKFGGGLTRLQVMAVTRKILK